MVVMVVVAMSMIVDLLLLLLLLLLLYFFYRQCKTIEPEDVFLCRLEQAEGRCEQRERAVCTWQREHKMGH